MKNALMLSLLLCLPFLGTSQEAESTDYLQRVGTIDAIVNSLYDAVSGEKGEARDWEFFRYLFHPEAKLIPSGTNREGKSAARYITADQYVESSGKWLLENGFFETEIHREVDQFGIIAHVFSTYNAFKSLSDEQPFMRGINSIQLLNDGERWWIINIYWTQENPSNPIPEKYLPKG